MSTTGLSTRWARELRCPVSDARLPLDEPAFLSPAGKPLLVDYDLDPRLGELWKRALSARSWDMWRYRELLPVANPARRVSLGEGGTPLVRLRRVSPEGIEVWLKQEAGNPTGSFKDRGLSMAVTRVVELGGPGVELPSAGNAAISISAYAAAAGLPARVAVPEETPAEVERRCREYGATVLRGGRTLVESAQRLAAEPSGYWNLSTLREPYRVEGKKTMGLEIAEQLRWELPDWLVYPTGGGTGIIGMHKVFGELSSLGLISGRPPRFVAVQMEGCAPIVRAWEEGSREARPWDAAETSIWGLRVPVAIGDFLILDALAATDGCAVQVPEAAIGEACRRLARDEGLTAGPEGGAVLLALDRLAEQGVILPGDRVVIVQTGHPANYGGS